MTEGSKPVNRRIIRRVLFFLACLVTLIALFYAVENWRGKGAWDKYRKESEAKGQPLDWTALVPPTVPDELNFFKAPYMGDWFIRGRSNELGVPLNNGKLPDFWRRQKDKADKVIVGNLQIMTELPPGIDKADVVLRFAEPSASEQAKKLLAELKSSGNGYE